MFPSILNTFNRPSATDRLNSPSHSALHNTVSSALGQVQAVIGQDGGPSASTLGTIIGDLRNPSSGGGGHVQSANKGGTGQTTFTKGDMLVATSFSVIAKFATGLDGQTIVVDSSVAAGIKWVNSQTNKVAVSAHSSVVGGAVVAESSIISVTIPGSTLGTNNAVRATVYIDTFQFGTAGSVLLSANYGGTVTGSVMLAAGAAGGGNTTKGKLEYIVFANSSVNAQSTNFLVNIARDQRDIGIVSSIMNGFAIGTSSVDSSADRKLGITARFSTTDGDNRVGFRGYTIEKII